MDTTIIVALLGAGSFGAILASVITGLFSKRKLGAEAAQIITQAAAGVVTQLNDEMVRMRADHAAERTAHDKQVAKITADHAAEMHDVRATLQLHVAWDTLALAKLHEIGIDLPPVPPLLPPRLIGE